MALFIIPNISFAFGEENEAQKCAVVFLGQDTQAMLRQSLSFHL